MMVPCSLMTLTDQLRKSDHLSMFVSFIFEWLLYSIWKSRTTNMPYGSFSAY